MPHTFRIVVVNNASLRQALTKTLPPTYKVSSTYFGATHEDLIITSLDKRRDVDSICERRAAYRRKAPRVLIYGTNKMMAKLPEYILATEAAAIIHKTPKERSRAQVIVQTIAHSLETRYLYTMRTKLLQAEQIDAHSQAWQLGCLLEDATGQAIALQVDMGQGFVTYYQKAFVDAHSLPEHFSLIENATHTPGFTKFGGRKDRSDIWTLDLGTHQGLRLRLVAQFGLADVEFGKYLFEYLGVSLPPILSGAMRDIGFFRTCYDMGRLEQLSADTSTFAVELEHLNGQLESPDKQIRRRSMEILQRAEFANDLLAGGPEIFKRNFTIQNNGYLELQPIWRAAGGAEAELDYKWVGQPPPHHSILVGILHEVLRLYAIRAQEVGGGFFLNFQHVNNGDMWHLSIGDNGVHLSDTQCLEILDGIYRHHNNLRLFEARLILRQWHGDLRISSGADGGLQISLTYPTTIPNVGPTYWAALQ